MSYDDDLNDSTLYDLERNDYSELVRLQQPYQLSFDNEIDFEVELDTDDMKMSADTFCSKFVGLLRDLEDIKFEMSKLKAEVQSLHDKSGIVMERLK